MKRLTGNEKAPRHTVRTARRMFRLRLLAMRARVFHTVNPFGWRDGLLPDDDRRSKYGLVVNY